MVTKFKKSFWIRKQDLAEGKASVTIFYEHQPAWDNKEWLQVHTDFDWCANCGVCECACRTILSEPNFADDDEHAKYPGV